jgi:hypothetical protein
MLVRASSGIETKHGVCIQIDSRHAEKQSDPVALASVLLRLPLLHLRPLYSGAANRFMDVAISYGAIKTSLKDLRGVLKSSRLD